MQVGVFATANAGCSPGMPGRRTRAVLMNSRCRSDGFCRVKWFSRSWELGSALFYLCFIVVHINKWECMHLEETQWPFWGISMTILFFDRSASLLKLSCDPNTKLSLPAANCVSLDSFPTMLVPFYSQNIKMVLRGWLIWVNYHKRLLNCLPCTRQGTPGPPILIPFQFPWIFSVSR